MKAMWALAVLVFSLLFGSALPVRAQPLASRSFDLLFAGDDPSERYDFFLTSNPQLPVVVQFNGFFENLAPEETGVRYGVSWYVGDTLWDGRQFTDEMGVRLPGADPLLGTTRVPISFEQPISFTPSETHFWVEGLGGSDRFRFVGDFAIQPIPEPEISALLMVAVLGGTIQCLRFRRK